jgi:hypothetical protein
MVNKQSYWYHHMTEEWYLSSRRKLPELEIEAWQIKGNDPHGMSISPIAKQDFYLSNRSFGQGMRYFAAIYVSSMPMLSQKHITESEWGNLTQVYDYVLQQIVETDEIHFALLPQSDYLKEWPINKIIPYQNLTLEDLVLDVGQVLIITNTDYWTH